MELFKSAKTVRLRSHHNKFLLANEDGEHVCQDRGGSSRNARWTVELDEESPAVVRLKSCNGLYLSASREPFLVMTGHKVLQSLPHGPDDTSVDWEPIRVASQVLLKSSYGYFLRANDGTLPPPWKNMVTHDIPHRKKTQAWVLWDVEIVEIRTRTAD